MSCSSSSVESRISRGTPRQCWCGQPSELCTSTSNKNPGRLYYCCARGYHKRHLFKWADECLVEEVDDLMVVISDMKKRLAEVGVNVARLENAFEGLRTGSDVRCFKNVVVCGLGLAVCCYYYFFM